MLKHRTFNLGKISNSMYLYYSLCCIVLALILDRLPDYANYQSLYENEGGYLLLQGRDLGFVLMAKVFKEYITYDLFRISIFLTSAAGAIYFSKHLQIHLARRLSILTSIPLLLIILMKFAIQFREGLAILIWMIYLTTHEKKLERTKFIFFATASSFFHLAIIPYWAATFLITRKNLKNTTTNYLTIVIFSISAYVVCSRNFLTANAQDLFATGKGAVIPTPYQYLYWSIFIAFPFYAYINSKWITTTTTTTTTKTKTSTIGDKIYALAPISIFGSIGISVIFLLFLVFDPATILNKNTLSDIIRIQTHLLTLILLQINFNKYFYAPIFLLLFLMTDYTRTIIESFTI